jgi:hypothetical protein
MKDLTYTGIMLALSTALFWFLMLFGIYIAFKMDPIYMKDNSGGVGPSIFFFVNMKGEPYTDFYHRKELPFIFTHRHQIRDIRVVIQNPDHTDTNLLALMD